MKQLAIYHLDQAYEQLVEASYQMARTLRRLDTRSTEWATLAQRIEALENQISAVDDAREALTEWGIEQEAQNSGPASTLDQQVFTPKD